MKKPARWEVVLMLVAFIGMVTALNWRRLEAERDHLHHNEVMTRIEEMRLGVVSAQPVALWLNSHMDSHNLAILDLIYGDKKKQENAVLLLEQDWQPVDAAKLVEALALSDSAQVQERLIALLTRQTGQKNNESLSAWKDWIVQQKIVPSKLESASYLNFKALLYHRIDPRLVHHFAIDKVSSVAPQEICWAGPTYFATPLLRPLLLNADQAHYLKEDDMIFGIVDKSGLALAFPQRIITWHNVVEVELNSGVVVAVWDEQKKAMTAYESQGNGSNFRFANSSFVYEGEHLITDERTHSLWSARSGKPLVADKSLLAVQLQALPVVSNSWAAWLKKYPKTKVLPVETGFDRDYSSVGKARN